MNIVYQQGWQSRRSEQILRKAQTIEMDSRKMENMNIRGIEIRLVIIIIIINYPQRKALVKMASLMNSTNSSKRINISPHKLFQ